MLQTAFPEIICFDHVELYVGNVLHSAHYYTQVWGLSNTASASPGTGRNDRRSVVLNIGSANLVLTGAVSADSPVADHLHHHGESIATVGVLVDDVVCAYSRALQRGALPLEDPVFADGDQPSVAYASVALIDGVALRFVERRPGNPTKFLPGFVGNGLRSVGCGPSIDQVDHIAICVRQGSLLEWVAFFGEVFGFRETQREDVATEYSGMKSIVVENDAGSCRFPLVEPAPGRHTSQVQEYLRFHSGPGVQHVAFNTRDVLSSVQYLRTAGVEFLPVPKPYFDDLPRRVPEVAEELDRLRTCEVLADADESGLLYQVFTKPCVDRPTLFMELIQRKGARGFGGRNIRALFEAVESEQLRRDNSEKITT